MNPNSSHRYIRVSVNVPQVSGTFDYHLPQDLLDRIRPGCLVEVPFGSQMVQGIVLRMVDTPAVPETKPVHFLVDPLPVVTDDQLKLAAWMEANSLDTISRCADLMLLPGLSKQAETYYSTTGVPLPKDAKSVQIRITTLASQKDGVRSRELDAAFGSFDWRPIARRLIQLGHLSSRSILPRPTLHPRMVRRVQITAPAEAIDFDQAPVYSRSARRLNARREIVGFLATHPEPIDLQWLRANLPVDFTNDDLNALAEVDAIRLWESEVIRDPVERIPPEFFDRHPLTSTQSSVWSHIEAAIGRASSGEMVKPILLHGVTGSGKTELYLRAVEETIRNGRTVLWLVPEISLTPQTVARILHRFPGQVGLVHSRLTDGERYDTWRRTRAGKIPILVGPRSVIFSPLEKVGLIVVDECHDPSYQQTEIAPYYNAVNLAIAYAGLTGAICLLGSATPDVAQMALAEREGWLILRLPERVRSSLPGIRHDPSPGRMPSVQVVDMRVELKKGNRSIFSESLQRHLLETFQKGQQSILYLNRRGASTHVFCRQCGFVLLCPRCSSALIAHGISNTLLCHTCGYRREKMPSCPKCGSSAFRPVGVGTETVEMEAAQLLPNARILRWDRDASRELDMDEIVLTHFRNHQYDILVGTQMIAKGLDFPHVTLVGLVLADVGLNLPDYRANERTFQLITQVAGRAGRGSEPGRVIVQTYQPEQSAILSAVNQDYEAFYKSELSKRRELGYPPYTSLVRLELRDPSDQKVRRDAADLADRIRTWLDEAGFKHTEIIGPAPCFFEKVRNQYRWQIILRGGDLLTILKTHQAELSTCRVELDPLNLL